MKITFHDPKPNGEKKAFPPGVHVHSPAANIIRADGAGAMTVVQVERLEVRTVQLHQLYGGGKSVLTVEIPEGKVLRLQAEPTAPSWLFPQEASTTPDYLAELEVLSVNSIGITTVEGVIVLEALSHQLQID